MFRLLTVVLPRLVIAGMSLSILSYLAILLYLLTQMSPSPRITGEVILVPGASVVVNKKYNPCLTGRVNEAVKIYKNQPASKIIMSGGTDTGTDNNEARNMAAFAMGQGVPQSDILLEPDSTSTYENLLYSQKIMQKQNLKTAIIVAEPFHIPRLKLVARKLGLSNTIAAAYTPCWTKWGIFSRAFLREPFALTKYWFDGKI